MYYNNMDPNYRVPPNPYQNPGYFQQQQVPYTQQRNPLQVKVINSPEEIMPGDVPMDGSMAFFIMNDQSGIFGKCWDRSGKLQTVYFPREEGLPQNTPSNDISERLDRIENQLNSLSQSIRRNNYKKGGMNNGYQRRPADESSQANRPTNG